jgi:hypothetical protein
MRCEPTAVGARLGNRRVTASLSEQNYLPGKPVRLYDQARALTALLFAMVLFFFPGIYYVTHVEVYFRRQIDPLIVAIAVYGVLPGSTDAQSSSVAEKPAL